MDGAMVTGGQRSMQNIDFPSRLVEQFFRRWIWYVLPIVLLAFVGIRAAGNVSQDFVASGTISATENPLVDGAPPARGTSIGTFEPPATGVSRLINEQLRSDTFVREVASRVGLDEALESGAISTATIRQQVSAGPEGENLLRVRATWSDPDTAFRLVEATTNAYLDLVSETVAQDSTEAIEFWDGVKLDATEASDEATANLREYTATLSPLGEGEQRTPVEELELTQLTAAVDAAQARVASLEDKIASAELSVQQSQSKAGRQLRIVDAPRPPSAPESAKIDKATTVLTFTFIGFLISLAALIVTTLLDQSIRSVAQLRLAASTDVVGTVPRTKEIKVWSNAHGGELT